MLGFDDDDAFGSSSATKPTEKALPAVNANPLDGVFKPIRAHIFQLTMVMTDGDDDFADFQAAPPSKPSSPVSNMTTTSKPSQQLNLFEMLNSTPAPAQANMQRPSSTPLSMQGGPFSSGAAAAPTMSPVSRSTIASPTTSSFGSASMGMGMGMGMGGVMSPTSAAPASAVNRPAMHAAKNSFSSTPSKSTSSGSGGFDDLWSMSLGGGGAAKPAAAGGAIGNKSIKDLEKEKAMGIWGAGKGQGGSKAQGSTSFGGLGGTGSTSGGDDLLL